MLPISKAEKQVTKLSSLTAPGERTKSNWVFVDGIQPLPLCCSAC